MRGELVTDVSSRAISSGRCLAAAAVAWRCLAALDVRIPGAMVLVVVRSLDMCVAGRGEIEVEWGRWKSQSRVDVPFDLMM